ncbi:MAG: FecR family protein [bacterium]|nr:FecR family protein [bacterium]
MHKKLFIFMVMILVLVSNLAQAKELGITITKIKGDCEIMRVSEVEWIKANVDMRLYLNDRIRTKLISQATLEFDDGTIIEMKEKTTIDIKELFESKWTGTTKSEMKLWVGKISGTIEKLKTRDSEFNIHTPVAVIGIRGTKIEIEVGNKGETTCRVRAGLVRMRGLQEPEDKWTTIKENESATCITGKKVSPPETSKPVPEEKPPFLLAEPLPSPKIKAQFPTQNKPFINRIPDVTVFISHPSAKNLLEFPICFLQIGDDNPIKLAKGITKYRFRPHLKPGPNELVIKAWYEDSPPGVTVVHFPFFDPHPPIIREKRVVPLEPTTNLKKQIGTSTGNRIIPVEVFVSAEDLGSGIKEVIVNGKRMEKIKEGIYHTVLSLVGVIEISLQSQSLKLQQIKLIVSDKADNLTIEVMDSSRTEKLIFENRR